MLAYSDRVFELPNGSFDEIFGRRTVKCRCRDSVWFATTYFAANERVVKIGSSVRPNDRIGGLNSVTERSRLRWLMGERPLDVMLVLPDSCVHDEKALHARFAPERLYREWYDRNGIVGGFFERLHDMLCRRAA